VKGTIVTENENLSNDFKNKTIDELASIKAHLIWLLMPTFLILVAVLGLSVFTWMEVSQLQLQSKSTEKSLDHVMKGINNMHKPVIPAPEAKGPAKD
jgi:hypothetical protein